METEESKVKVPADSVPGGALFPAYRRPPAHCVLKWQREGERVLWSLFPFL